MSGITGIYHSLARGRRVYQRLIGGLAAAQAERQGQDGAGHQVVSPVSDCTSAPEFAPPSGSVAFFPPPEPEEAPAAVGFSLSPSPPDPLETAELFELAARQEERFVCQNLRREER